MKTFHFHLILLLFPIVAQFHPGNSMSLNPDPKSKELFQQGVPLPYVNSNQLKGAESELDHNSNSNKVKNIRRPLTIEVDDPSSLNIIKNCRKPIHLSLKITTEEESLWEQFNFKCQDKVINLTISNVGSDKQLKNLLDNFKNLESLQIDKPKIDYISTVTGSPVNFPKLKEITFTNLSYESKAIGFVASKLELPILESITVRNSFLSDLEIQSLNSLVRHKPLRSLVLTDLGCGLLCTMSLLQDIDVLPSMETLTMQVQNPSRIWATKAFWENLKLTFPNLNDLETNLEINVNYLNSLPLKSLRILDIVVFQTYGYLNVDFLKEIKEAEKVNLFLVCDDTNLVQGLNKQIKISGLEESFELGMKKLQLTSSCNLKVSHGWQLPCRNYLYQKDTASLLTTVSMNSCQCRPKGCID